MIQFYQKVQEALTQRLPFVLVTMVEARGSAPQEVGAKMMVTLEFKKNIHENEVASPLPTPYFGTIGGGKVEARALQVALELLLQKTSPSASQPSSSTLLVTWNLQKDIGMTCGGEVTLFFETYGVHTWEVAVFGAGHVSQALIPLLLTLECHVTCIDTRKEWLDQLPHSPALTRIHTLDLPSMVEKLHPESFIVSITQGHAMDLPVLRQILRTRVPPYLGVIGSKSKANRLKSDLLKEGFSPEQCASFFCPLGLAFGKNSPPEIAISIVAQLLQERDRHFQSLEKK